MQMNDTKVNGVRFRNNVEFIAQDTTLYPKRTEFDAETLGVRGQQNKRDLGGVYTNGDLCFICCRNNIIF